MIVADNLPPSLDPSSSYSNNNYNDNDSTDMTRVLAVPAPVPQARLLSKPRIHKDTVSDSASDPSYTDDGRSLSSIDDYKYDDYEAAYDDGYDDDDDEEGEEEGIEEENHEEDAVYRVLDIVHSICQPAAIDSTTGQIVTVSPHDEERHDDRTSGLDQEVTCRLRGEWLEFPDRYKDYVSEPKPSGYQSLHLTLYHKHTGVQMEVQIRSARMHWVAEFGSASHRFYKALALPTSSADPRSSSSASSGPAAEGKWVEGGED